MKPRRSPLNKRPRQIEVCAALGLRSQEFTTEQFIRMTPVEIEQLRSAGKKDVEIAQILERDVGVRVSTDSIRRFFSDETERVGYL